MPSSSAHPSLPRPRIRVKICGITRIDDALAAAEAGADAIGLVFFADSPRAVTAEQAATITASLPPFVSTVGLFVNPTADAVARIMDQVALDLLQFHGDEAPEFCQQFAKPYLKAFRVRQAVDDLGVERYQGGRGILLDAWDDQRFGGTGKAFDWHQVSQLARGQRIVLAGGLKPANVAEAIRIAQPWAVDVSSGVEQAPGRKSAQLIQEFISEVNRV